MLKALDLIIALWLLIVEPVFVHLQGAKQAFRQRENDSEATPLELIGKKFIRSSFDISNRHSHDASCRCRVFLCAAIGELSDTLREQNVMIPEGKEEIHLKKH